MKKILMIATILIFSFFVNSNRAQPENDSHHLRVMIIGAHPDDAEKSGGTAAMYTAQGHTVQLVSLTNGDAGHFETGGGALAKRRVEEAHHSAQVIRAKYVVLDNHDGELVPTLENRRQVIRLIREFKPDLIITHRPNDYHPDHRYTGVLVQDAAYMVTVPNIVPGTPHLDNNPVIVYMSDGFTKPTPFEPDVVVGIDEVIEKKIDMYHCHTSQFYEWLPYNKGILDQVPQGEAERRAWLAEWLKPWSQNVADKYRYKLIELYGREKGATIRYAEAFEDSEYGAPLTKTNIDKLFPFFK